MLDFSDKICYNYKNSFAGETEEFYTEDLFMKKRNKLLIFVSIVLCCCVLFAACDKRRGENVQTTATTVFVDDRKAVDPENDIKMLVELYNSKTLTSSPVDSFANIDKTIYSYLKALKMEVSNLELDGEEVFDKALLKDGVLYFEDPGSDSNMYMMIDETLLMLGMGFSDGDLKSTVIIDSFQEIKEALNPENLGVEDFEYDIPLIKASDFVDEGNGVYSISDEYIKELYAVLCEGIVADLTEDAAAAQEVIDTAMEYILNMDMRLAYKVQYSKVVSIEESVNYSSDVLAEFAREVMNMPELNEEYSLEIRSLADVKNNIAMPKEMYLDIYFPITAYQDGINLAVGFIDAEVDFALDTGFITNSSDIFHCDLGADLIIKAYTESRGSFKYNKQYSEQMAESGLSIMLNTSLSKGKFVFDMISLSEGKKSTSSISADVNLENVYIPELSQKADQYIDKFNRISRDKKKIDAHIETVISKISDKVDEQMMYAQLQYYYSEYDIVAVFNVIYDYDTEGILVELDTYSFYSVDGITSTYTVTKNGEDYIIVRSAQT